MTSGGLGAGSGDPVVVARDRPDAICLPNARFGSLLWLLSPARWRARAFATNWSPKFRNEDIEAGAAIGFQRNSA